MFACLGLVGLIGVTVLVGEVGAVVVARHRVQAAADLGALAAAGALPRGVEVACAEAAEISRQMGVRMERCAVVQWDATVAVVGNVPIGLFGAKVVYAIARAGPIEVTD